MVGRLVISKAGRDKNRLMVVVGCEEGALFVCDGKERPLSRPKRKNIKHIALTNMFLSEEEFLSDKSLRRALAIRRGTAEN